MTHSASTLRSDSLPALRPLIGPNGMFKMFEDIFQLTLIVDANIILGEIRWLAVKRKHPNARSDLKELLDAKTVLAIAPTFLKKEIEVNLSKLAVDNNVELVILEEHWKLLQSHISFVDVGGPDDTFKDPKDAPYIKLQRCSGHLIYSRDRDILDMGGKIASSKMVASLRIYSRNAVIEYTLKVAGVGTFNLSFVLITTIIRFVRSSVPHARRIPRGLWWGVVLLILAALIYEPSRLFLRSLVESMTSKSKAIGRSFIAQFELSWHEHMDAKRVADDALRRLQGTSIP